MTRQLWCDVDFFWRAICSRLLRGTATAIHKHGGGSSLWQRGGRSLSFGQFNKLTAMISRAAADMEAFIQCAITARDIIEYTATTHFTCESNKFGRLGVIVSLLLMLLLWQLGSNRSTAPLSCRTNSDGDVVAGCLIRDLFLGVNLSVSRVPACACVSYVCLFRLLLLRLHPHRNVRCGRLLCVV